MVVGNFCRYQSANTRTLRIIAIWWLTTPTKSGAFHHRVNVLKAARLYFRTNDVFVVVKSPQHDGSYTYFEVHTLHVAVFLWCLEASWYAGEELLL